MSFPSDVVAAPATNINQSESMVSLSPLSGYFKECLMSVGLEVTLQLLLALYRRAPMEEADSQTRGDPLEPYARVAVGTGYADEFLM